MFGSIFDRWVCEWILSERVFQSDDFWKNISNYADLWYMISLMSTTFFDNSLNISSVSFLCSENISFSPLQYQQTERFYYSYPCSNALYFSAVRIFGLQRRQAPLIKTWWPLFHSKHRPHLGLYTFGEKASTNNLTTTHYDDKNQGQSFVICNHKTLELLSW